MNHNKHYWQCKIFAQFAMNSKCLNPECLQDAWDKAHIVASFINDKNKEQHEDTNPYRIRPDAPARLTAVLSGTGTDNNPGEVPENPNMLQQGWQGSLRKV